MAKERLMDCSEFMRFCSMYSLVRSVMRPGLATGEGGSSVVERLTGDREV